MENLKTRHPKKIIVEWEEIVEKFRENQDKNRPKQSATTEKNDENQHLAVFI